MAAIVLGRLEKVILRETWPTEAMDFTPWLAQEENLSLLGETLGIELELEAQEKNVGPFRADILCKDTLNGHWVLIENQIERTDHTHLGQLLTYAAGLKAVTIVWIAAEFTDEHRAALDWLNEATNEGINFFGLEIELWKIGNSLAAPKFNVVSQPNDWTETVRSSTRGLETQIITETQAIQLEFWTALCEFMKENDPSIKTPKPSPSNFVNFPIGRSNFTVFALTNSFDRRLTAGLYLSGKDAKPHFYLLQEEKGAIEKEFGATLEWNEKPEGVESNIAISRYQFDINDRSCWPEFIGWVAKMVIRFNSVFRRRVKNLNAADYRQEMDSNFESA